MAVDRPSLDAPSTLEARVLAFFRAQAPGPLLLARYGNDDPVRTIPTVSQEILAEMVGTTRSRVNFFMNRFRKLGFIEYNGGIEINKSLMSVVLHD